MSELIEIYKENTNTIFIRIGKLFDNIQNLPAEKSESSFTEVEKSIKESERIVIRSLFLYF